MAQRSWFSSFCRAAIYARRAAGGAYHLLRASRLLGGKYTLVAIVGLLTVVFAGLLVVTPRAFDRPPVVATHSSAQPPAPAPDVAEVLARAKALKTAGRINDALQVIEDAMQLPEAPQMLTSPDLHWVQAWLLVTLSETTGRHMYVRDAGDEFKAVVRLTAPDSDLGREARRALHRISGRE